MHKMLSCGNIKNPKYFYKLKTSETVYGYNDIIVDVKEAIEWMISHEYNIPFMNARQRAIEENPVLQIWASKNVMLEIEYFGKNCIIFGEGKCSNS